MIFNRPDEQVFASTAKSGEVVDFPDILRGWGLTFEQAGGIPPMEWFNAVGLRTDQSIQYLLQNGIPEWGIETDYPEGAYARYNNKIWRSRKRNSGNEPTALNDNWEQAALTVAEVKALIPQLMTQEEFDAGESKTPRTINAQLLKSLYTPLMTKSELDKGTSTEPRTINAALLKIISSKGQYPFHSVNTSTTLTEDLAGVILIDASAGAIDITLPETKENIGFILKRIDSSLNTVKVKVSGTDKIKYNLLINANGYSFFNLFGAGDYWHVVSDGNGSWYDLNRADKTAIGTISYQSSIIAPVGGYVVANGSLLKRVDFPYLWDYAQKSGLLVEESNFSGNEGCFSTGDGASTFRVPDLRSTFLRVLDNSKGTDSGRTAGSWQKGSLSFVDTGSAGTWSSYDTTRTDAIDVALKKAGLDSFNTSDYSGVRMAGAGAPTVIDLPGTGLDYAYAGVSRPNNIAYPVYLKII